MEIAIMAKKVKGKKPLTYYPIARKKAGGPRVYDILDRLIEAHHPDLKEADARILLAWRKGWRQDADGRLRLAQARKASELDRALAPNDFVILLNQESFQASGFGEDAQAAILDHELMHCAVTRDRDGDIKRDEKNRVMFRLRAHQIEEFTDVFERHGMYNGALEAFAERAVAHSNMPLLGTPPKSPRAGKTDGPSIKLPKLDAASDSEAEEEIDKAAADQEKSNRRPAKQA